MKLYAVLIFLFLLISYTGNSQLDLGCVTLDFETINGIPSSEGLEIDNQFFAQYGLTFSREDGGLPVIARVGGTVTDAFGSAWGSNQPAPGIDIGEFFLTDDGILSGTFAPPLLLQFNSPLDSISGCNLDIDFDEQFIIQSLGIDGNVIREDIIISGDPGTGDGALTCWGFNLISCEEKIYGVRLEGFRPSGAFGLGIDNISFCQAVVTDNVNLTCEEVNGSITLLASEEGFTYSIDGINYQEETTFSNLPAGTYTIYVADEEGCVYTLEAVLFEIPPVEIDEIITVDTSCGETNGSATILATPSLGNTYSIDEFESFQESATFSDLPPGDYEVTVVDRDDCITFAPFTILPSIPASISIDEATNDFCSLSIGTITVNGIFNEPLVGYSLNEGPLQTSPTFDNLSEGEYSVSIIDSIGCTAFVDVTLQDQTTVIIDNAIVSDANCAERFGSIEILASQALGNITYSLDSTNVFQQSNLFENVEPGLHTVYVNDEQGCRVPVELEIGIPDCPIFFPNIFCPSCGDPDNTEFVIGSTNLYDICILRYEVYDRWGNLIYYTDKFSIHDNGSWWDGTFDNVPAEQGVYVYVIEALHENGLQEIYSGDITLIR